MAKKDMIVQDGKVIKVLPNSMYRIQLENGHVVLARSAGRMKNNRISVILGDTVRLEISPYDLNRGLVVYRYK